MKQLLLALLLTGVAVSAQAAWVDTPRRQLGWLDLEGTGFYVVRPEPDVFELWCDKTPKKAPRRRDWGEPRRRVDLDEKIITNSDMDTIKETAESLGAARCPKPE